MNNNKYNIGEFVVFRSSDGTKVIGKIEELYTDDDTAMFKYNEYYYPEKTSSKLTLKLAGRQEHNSKYEIYRTDCIAEAITSTIEYKCEVFKFEDYIKRLLNIKEKYKNTDISNYLATEKLFFFRQMYSSMDEAFYPDSLPTSCYCDKIFNPDKNFIQCKECKELIHVECFLEAETQKCSKCNNSISNQMSSTSTHNDNFLGVKRQRSDDIVPGPRNIERKPEQHVEEKKQEEAKVAYPNLSEERRKYLLRLIERLDKENTGMVNKYMAQEERSRKVIRDKICYSLLYGIEEIKESGDWKKMKVEHLAKGNISEREAIKCCTDLGVAIESAIYYQNDKTIVKYLNFRLKTTRISLSLYVVT
jgi:hypothetical protein